MVSTESGSFTSARTIVQLYLDNKDLGQVGFVCDDVERDDDDVDDDDDDSGCDDDDDDDKSDC